MSSRLPARLPPRLEAERQRFEHWRSQREGLSRIPEPLWRSAVTLAREFGVHRTAKVLRLNYDALKARAGSASADEPTSPTTPATFVELVPGTVAGAGKCVVEFDDGHGARMCVHLEHADATVLAALAGALVGGAR